MRDLDFTIVINNWRYFLEGAALTVQLSAIAVIAGLVLGSLFGLARISSIRPVRSLATAYVEFVRGTPLFVQILIIYAGLPSFGIKLDRFVSGVLALSINSGAYVAEIVRSGIQSIDKGQMEAARSLGMSYLQAMRFVILPQAYRRIIPPLVNEFIILIKDSSLVSVIGLSELMRRGQNISARTFYVFEVFFAVALIYFILTFTLSKFAGWLERRTRIRD